MVFSELGFVSEIQKCMCFIVYDVILSNGRCLAQSLKYKNPSILNFGFIMHSLIGILKLIFLLLRAQQKKFELILVLKSMNGAFRTPSKCTMVF